MQNKRKLRWLLLLIFMVSAATAQSTGPLLPYLEKRGKAVQLIVNGKPYLILGGELHNSSSSSLAYMQNTWDSLEKAHLNTVLAAVSWELMEPQEGKFDFHLVDGMIRQARAHHLHLILLWFGSWKNGESTYAPAWVKHDQRRFPLVRIRGGADLDILSPLGTETLRADATAFARLMGHLKQTDGKEHTVLMVQVENEVGVLGDSRDRSELADKAFSAPVPEQFFHYLEAHKDSLRPHIYQLWKAGGFKRSGNWKDVFGADTATDEIFMAWCYAHFINEVVRAGKAVYPLPMYVNTWIVQPNDKDPGDYPSGGPQAHMHDVWKAAAPKIDMLCPDIYLAGFAGVCQKYRESGKGFFIPEARAGALGAAQAFYAIGAMDAVGYSPFGVDGITGFSDGPMSAAYQVLQQLTPLILTAQQQGQMAAVSLDKSHPVQRIRLGNYILEVALRHGWDTSVAASQGYALMIATAPDTYYVAGNDFQITFFPASGTKLVGFDQVEEGVFKEGKWQPGRRLNGDEISNSIRLAAMAAQHKTGKVLRIQDGPGIRKVKVYRF
jgi:hypothetical protein